jgi:phosphate transport system protein
MPREEYQVALADLRGEVRAMGELVLEQLADALRAMAETDESLARSVVEGDDAVNEQYLAIESTCVDLFALQQPVAGDLRFVAAAFKIITDLERVGDLATNLGRYTLAADRELHPEVDVQAIGQDAHDLLADALDTFVASADAARPVDGDRSGGTVDGQAVTTVCHEISDRDNDIDVCCQRGYEWVVRGLIEREAGDGGPWELEPLLDDVTRLLLTLRDLERVGDHAVNVAARTLYMVENDASLLY